MYRFMLCLIVDVASHLSAVAHRKHGGMGTLLVKKVIFLVAFHPY